MLAPPSHDTQGPDSAPIRIFLTEDHPVLREACVSVLNREKGLTVCGAVPTAEEALVFVRDHPCDVLVTDVSLPGMDGLELARRLRTVRPDLRIVVISAHADLDYATRARSIGAQAFLRKDRLALTLVPTLRAVLRSTGWVEVDPAGSP